MARRDNVIRFLSRRFPSEPSSDTNWVNPSLPPGASRLAIPVGHSGSHRRPHPDPPGPEWFEVFAHTRQRPGATPAGIAMGRDSYDIVIGLPNASGGDPGSFVAYTADTTGGTYTIMGPEYTDPGFTYAFGTSAAITDTEQYVHVGDPQETNFSLSQHGMVWLFLPNPLNPGGWNRSGITASTGVANQLAGTSLAVSPFITTDPTPQWTLATGAPMTSGSGDAARAITQTMTGFLRSNVQVVTDVVGSGFGTTVGVTDGAQPFLVVGMPNVATGTDCPGRVANYQDTGSGWGASIGDWGTSEILAISSDATLMLTGCVGTERVRLYRLNGTFYQELSAPSAWTRTGSGTDFGSAVAINGTATSSSLEGTVVAIGEPGYSTPLLPAAGRVTVWEYTGSGWARIYSPIDGQSEGERFGEKVVLSGDGQVLLATGAASIGRTAVYSIPGGPFDV